MRMLGAASLLLAACASAPPARVPDPAATSRMFFAALCADRRTEAWALLDPTLRAGLDRVRFEALATENAAELAEVCERVRHTDARAQGHARVELVDGEAVLLVLEDGRWRIAGGLLDAQALATPEDTVHELRRALQRRSLAALLRLLARERRAVWTATLERTLEATSDPHGLEVEVRGDEAVVRLTGGGEVHLKREGGEWKVWDVR